MSREKFFYKNCNQTSQCFLPVILGGYQSGKSLSSHTSQKPTDVRYCETGDRGFRVAHRKKR